VIGSTPTAPISIALIAGGLTVINPCGFPLLPCRVRKSIRHAARTYS
jgi:cytochrome c biogenesis protein CcdA